MKLVFLLLSSSKEKKSKRVNYAKSDKETQSESILVLIHILQVEQDEFKVEDLRGMYMCVPVLDCVCVCVRVCADHCWHLAAPLLLLAPLQLRLPLALQASGWIGWQKIISCSYPM